jgi:hypothetical protein
MHKDIVADNPKVGMEFMYHRRDGLWMFKVASISEGYIIYEYKYYKGSKPRDRLTIEELVHWCDHECKVGWSNGSSNTLERWKMFVSTGGENSDYPVCRVILVDQMADPSWEV